MAKKTDNKQPKPQTRNRTIIDKVPPLPEDVKVEQTEQVESAPAAQASSELPITDPRRKLTKEERATLTPEQRSARRAARKAGRAPVKTRVFRTMSRMSKRVSRIAGLFPVESDLGEAIAMIVAGFKNAMPELEALPADWKPAHRERSESSGRSMSLVEGDIVTLSESKMKHYDGILPLDELKELRFTKVAGKRGVAETKSGIPLFLPLTHFTFVSRPSKDEQPAESTDSN